MSFLLFAYRKYRSGAANHENENMDLEIAAYPSLVYDQYGYTANVSVFFVHRNFSFTSLHHSIFHGLVCFS